MTESLSNAKSREMELLAEQEIVSSELETIRAKLQARNEEPPPPPPSPVETDEDKRQQPGDFPFSWSENR